MSRTQLADSIKSGLVIGLITMILTMIGNSWVMETKLSYIQENAAKQEQVCKERYVTNKAEISNMKTIYETNRDRTNEKLEFLTVGYAVLKANKQDKK
jgi:hypothetical protein